MECKQSNFRKTVLIFTTFDIRDVNKYNWGVKFYQGMKLENNSPCTSCGEGLGQRYIKCVECEHFICLNCFSKGFERPPHYNDHPYEVYKYDFSMFDSSWSVQKEFDLLDAINVCGYGNWTEIQEYMQKLNNYPYLTNEMCEIHYNKYYLIYPHFLLPDMPRANTFYTQPHGLPFKTSIDPPRPDDGSLLHQEMGGYSAPRGDFMIEYNDYAEFNLRDMICNDDTDEVYDEILPDDEKTNLRILENELNLEVIKIYRGILKDRWKRKKKIIEFGLISMNKEIIHCKRYESLLGHHFIKTMKVMTTFMKPMQWDLCLESFYLAQKAKKQIQDLRHYRENGLRYKQSVAIFRRLHEKRKEARSKMNMMSNVIQYLNEETKHKPWIEKKNVLEGLTAHIKLPKRSSAPLDISKTPGTNLLTEAEKELCSTSRLVPANYLEFKQMLIAENAKHGSLRLAQARTLIKIDVNKTRKIFDFLVNEKLIQCNEDNSRKRKKMLTNDDKDNLLTMTDNQV